MKNYLKSKDGTIAIIVAICIIVLLGFGAFAVDLGFLYMKKIELQNAADAAALAGAAALVSYGNDLNQVKVIAMDYGRRNFTVQNNPENAIVFEDITFYKDYILNSTDPNQVEVTARRTETRGNPLTLFLAPALGFDVMDVTATARAEVYHPAGSRCVKPFVVPMPFIWDDLPGGQPGVMDVQPESKSEVHTISWVKEFWTDADIGTQIRLKVGDPAQAIAPGQYSAIDLPPVNKGTPITGGDAYRENIYGCNESIVEIGDELQMEPGNMVGPTQQGMRDLIAQDPNAHWDDVTKSIRDSRSPDPLGSPRIGIIAFYSPKNPPTSGRNTVFVVQIGGFFIEGMQGGDVMGRYVGAMAANPGPGSGTGPPNPLLYAIRLIRDSTRGAL